MRVGVLPDGVLERLALAAGVVPAPLVLGSWGMMAYRSLVAGVRLGVFEALADGQARSAAEVAAATACSEQGIEVLLSALSGLRYVRRRAGRYRNGAQATRWLLRSSRFSLRDAVIFLGELWDRMGSFEEAVRRGSPPRLHEAGLPPAFWERYMRGLATFARLAAPEVVRRARLRQVPTRLLDVGGGHGLYAAAFCRRYPGLAAEVLDLPEAAAHGRRIVEEAGASERVVYREGDMRDPGLDWGQGQDVVLLFNVLHNATSQEAVAMIGRARGALRPGGALLILEAQHESGDGDLSQSGGFNELFFFVVSGARAHSEEVMRGWLKEAGFQDLRRSTLRLAPAVLLAGYAPAP